jgi:hypothetical protein
MSDVRGSSPSREHPLVFKLRDLLNADAVLTSQELEVYIEWQDGTYGSKVPVVVIRKADS